MIEKFLSSGRLALVNFILVIVALVGLPVVYGLAHNSNGGSAASANQLVADNSSIVVAFSLQTLSQWCHIGTVNQLK